MKSIIYISVISISKITSVIFFISYISKIFFEAELRIKSFAFRIIVNHVLIIIFVDVFEKRV